MCRLCSERPVRAKYGKLCEGCHERAGERRKQRKAAWSKQNPRPFAPCAICGERKPKPTVGTQYCVDCVALAREVAPVKRRAKIRSKNKPCRGCRGVKDRPKGAYCSRCVRERERVPMCRRCCERPVRAKHAKMCDICVPIAAAEQRQKKNERERRYVRSARRSAPSSPQSQRMKMRLRSEREGRELRPAPPILDPSNLSRVDSYAFPRLPAMPLYRAVRWLIEQEATSSAFGRMTWSVFSASGDLLDPVSAPRDDCPGLVPSVGARLNPGAGDGALERRMSEWARVDREWRAGVGVLIGPRLESGSFLGSGSDLPRVAFDLADRILTNSGLLWFEVWDGPELCSNGRTVEWVFTTTEVSCAA